MNRSLALLIVVSFLLGACAPSVVATSIPTVAPAAPSGFEDVDVGLSSTKIPGCLSEGESFKIFVTTTFRDQDQTDSATFNWRRVPDSADVEILNAGQGRKFTMAPTQVASFTITVNLINETGTAQPYAAKIPLFRFDTVDERGFACFSWVD